MRVLTPNEKYVFECRDPKDDPSYEHSLDFKVIKETWVENVYQINKGDFYDSKIFIDIGANIGSVSLFVASFNDDLKGSEHPIQIYSFEPQPDNFELLGTNILNNNVSNILPLKKAIYKERGEMKITNRGGNSSLLNHPGASTDVCDVITMQDIFDIYKISECDVMKIDIEGAEYELIINTPDEVLKKVKYLTLEFDDDRNGKFGEMITKIARLFNTHILGSPERGGYIYGRRY